MQSDSEKTVTAFLLTRRELTRRPCWDCHGSARGRLGRELTGRFQSYQLGRREPKIQCCLSEPTAVSRDGLLGAC